MSAFLDQVKQHFDEKNSSANIPMEINDSAEVSVAAAQVQSHGRKRQKKQESKTTVKIEANSMQQAAVAENIEAVAAAGATDQSQ